MPVWAWVLIGVAVALVVAFAVWQLVAQRRRHRLRDRFGPEYERTVNEADNRGEAEAELREREQRRAELDIRPLEPGARDRYRESWQQVQSEFVDHPAAAVGAADSLIQSVMVERGYPVEDFDDRVADVSVDHPRVVDNYRQGHRLARLSASGEGTTEDLRQAMTHYRALFDELVEDADGDGRNGSSRSERERTATR
jgi:hypothetical protein